MALMVWAAADDMGNPSLRTFTAWGSALAVFWAAVSWRLLVSADAETGGRSLRRVSRGAPTRTRIDERILNGPRERHLGAGL